MHFGFTQPTDSTPDFVPAATTVHHVSSESENELPEVMLSGTPSVSMADIAIYFDVSLLNCFKSNIPSHQL